jgi:hypothetical protein
MGGGMGGGFNGMGNVGVVNYGGAVVGGGLVMVGDSLSEHIYISIAHGCDPSFGLTAKLIGPQGSYLKHISDKTSAKVVLQGKEQSITEIHGEPLSLRIIATTRESLEEAKVLCQHLVKTIEQKYMEYKKSNPYMQTPLGISALADPLAMEQMGPMAASRLQQQINQQQFVHQQRQQQLLLQQQQQMQMQQQQLIQIQQQQLARQQASRFGQSVMPNVPPGRRIIVDPLDQNIGSTGVGYFQSRPTQTGTDSNTTATTTNTAAQPGVRTKRRFQEVDAVAEVEPKVTSKIAMEKKKAEDRRVMPPPPVSAVLASRQKRKQEEENAHEVESSGSFKLVSYS